MAPHATDPYARLGDPARLSRLAGYDLFHPGLKARMEIVASRSAERLGAPVSLVSVISDRSQFILGGHGISGWVPEPLGTPAEWALCTHTVLAGEPYCIIDGATDPVHAGNPLLELTGVRSYGGVPLVDGSGHTLGAHCVIDLSPRTFTERDLAVLREGADEAMRILGDYPSA